VGEDDQLYHDPEAANAAGFPGLVAPPMFCAVYCAPAMIQGVFDRDVGIDPTRLVHGGQTFVWGEAVCAGDTITTTSRLADAYARDDKAFFVFESTSTNQRGQETLAARYTAIVLGKHGRARTPISPEPQAPEAEPASGEGEPQTGDVEDKLREGSSIPELRVTPDKYAPYRYAGASGDFTPIHIDPELARAMGLPGNILHGLYTMALVARAQEDAAGGDPRSLRELRVQFRGMAFPEQEIAVTGRVTKRLDGEAVIATVASQGGREIIRNARAILRIDSRDSRSSLSAA
jgi:acyl dehydratase